MNPYVFFEKICFGENGYPISITQITEFIDSHKNNLEALKHDAIIFESQTIAKKYNKETGNTEPIYRMKDKSWLSKNCGKWPYFLNELDKLINKSYDSNNLNEIYERLCEELSSFKVLLVGSAKEVYYRNKRDSTEGYKKENYDNKSYRIYLLDLQNDYITKINQLTNSEQLIKHHENFILIQEKLILAFNRIWSYMPDGYSIIKDLNEQYPDFKLKDFLIDILSILKSELLIENVRGQSDHQIVNDIKIVLELDEEISYGLDTVNKIISKLKPILPIQNNTSKITGFKSTLKTNQIESLYEKTNEKYFKTSLKIFIAFLSAKPVIEKIVYINNKKNGSPHVTALREFFTLLKITPTASIISKVFIDSKGDEIKLPKAKKTEFSSHYNELEKIIQSL